jgi:hypothetical protein
LQWSASGGSGPRGAPPRPGRAPPIERQAVEEEEEEEVEEEEEEEKEETLKEEAASTKKKKLSRAALLKRLNAIGRCEQDFAWDTGQLVSASGSSCGNCGKPVVKGYRCKGGTHYVCEKCAHKW